VSAAYPARDKDVNIFAALAPTQPRARERARARAIVAENFRIRRSCGAAAALGRRFLASIRRPRAAAAPQDRYGVDERARSSRATPRSPWRSTSGSISATSFSVARRSPAPRRSLARRTCCRITMPRSFPAAAIRTVSPRLFEIAARAIDRGVGELAADDAPREPLGLADVRLRFLQLQRFDRHYGEIRERRQQHPAIAGIAQCRQQRLGDGLERRRVVRPVVQRVELRKDVALAPAIAGRARILSR